MTNLGIATAVNARGLTSGVLAVGCAAAIAACGSSSAPASPPASRDPALAYARCLRANGVPNFPDPSPGAPVRIPSNIDTEAPAFRSAQSACASLTPGSANGAGSSSESRRLELLAIAKCMRAHGVPNFADPTSSPPAPTSGNAIGGNGTYLAIGPPPNRQSPAFKTAASACRLP